MRLLNIRELRSVKGIDFSKPHIYRLINAGKFPRPVPMSEKRVAWVESELDDWIKDRMDARTAA